MTVCTFSARTLALEASIEDLMMQARKIRYDVIALIETKTHRPLNATFDTSELFLGTCDNRGVDGVGVFVNTNLVMNIDSFEQLTTPNRIGEIAAKFKKWSPKPVINWGLFTSSAGFREDAFVDNIDEEYDRLVQHLRESAEKAEGSRATKRRLSYETLDLIGQCGAARAAGNYRVTS
ncbi:hypothetical protein ANCCAN_05206 [Ancylostoma caninum]|uniref:Uncharacterized protein n=1 Tax=Ancylostoma caninum TaxID=29170 RepID=A0A368GWN6_ANCCA|nr:hypothetical protein ANCCAN_05206 [Ancylostoma caninum]